MSDEKRISDLPETTVVAVDDIFEVAVKVPGGYESKRVQGQNLLPSGVIPSGVVLDTGDQTIGGVKTFSSLPLLPSGIVPSGRQAVSAARLAEALEEVGDGGADIGTIYAINA